MTEAMPFLQKYDITFLRPPTIPAGHCLFHKAVFQRVRVAVWIVYAVFIYIYSSGLYADDYGTCLLLCI